MFYLCFQTKWAWSHSLNSKQFGCRSSHLWRCSLFLQVQLLVGVRLALVRVVGLEVFSPVVLLLLGVCCGCWVFVCVFSVFFSIFSFLILCWSIFVWPYQKLSVNCFLLNKICAQPGPEKISCRITTATLRPHWLVYGVFACFTCCLCHEIWGKGLTIQLVIHVGLYSHILSLPKGCRCLHSSATASNR